MFQYSKAAAGFHINVCVKFPENRNLKLCLQRFTSNGTKIGAETSAFSAPCKRSLTHKLDHLEILILSDRFMASPIPTLSPTHPLAVPDAELVSFDMCNIKCRRGKREKIPDRICHNFRA